MPMEGARYGAVCSDIHPSLLTLRADCSLVARKPAHSSRLLPCSLATTGITRLRLNNWYVSERKNRTSLWKIPIGSSREMCVLPNWMVVRVLKSSSIIAILMSMRLPSIHGTRSGTGAYVFNKKCDSVGAQISYPKNLAGCSLAWRSLPCSSFVSRSLSLSPDTASQAWSKDDRPVLDQKM